MLKNLKKVAAIVLSFAMAVQFGLADSYYVNAVEEPVEPQQEETTTAAPQEQEEVPTAEEETPQQQEEQQQPAVEEEQPAPETKSVELSYVAEDGTVLHETASRDFNLDYSLKTDSSVMLNFDGYTLKDVIINNSQTVPADQANLSVTSDLVSVKFVYVSVNTKEDKQTSENNEQTKTEEANEDDAEADPETKEELPEYPAFDQSETAGNVVVHATAAEGVLPRDSKLVVKRITRKAILNAVEDTVSEKNKEMDSAVALDITIQNKDGVEIQPNGSVNISFENAAVSGDEINVYHVTDDASAVTEVATNTQSFDANHFSIYVITGEKEKPLTTFNFVDANGKPVSTQIVKTGDTLITPTAPDVAGKAFVGWYEGETKFEDFNTALTITETKTRTITAKYENALYVYFYNPAGTQIMRTEKVGDHEVHGYTDVSYDVDSTHKLVGWAAERNGTENIADKITVPKGSTSVNVYAIIKEGYWISFDSNGGSIVDSQFVLNGDKLVLNKSTTPTKPGYTFNGWYNDSTKVENGATVTNPMTLKAHWTAAEVNYTINYWQQKVTDDKNATDAQKTYEYVEAVTEKATTGTKISATNSKTYKGFKYNANNSSKDVEIAGDGTTIINVYYDRVLCTVNFYVDKGGYYWSDWQITKTVTGLYGANLPEGAWDSSKNLWFTTKSYGSNAVLLTSFDFETAGYAKNQDNVSENGIVTTCNFYAGSGLNGTIKYYNEQADGTFKLVQTVRTNGNSLTVHEKYEGYELYKYSTGSNAQETAQYWNNRSSVKDKDVVNGNIINIASKLKTYSLSYYNYNKVTKTEKSIKYTASLKSYANYTPARPSELPDYYVFGGWYKDKACTTKFDFNTEKMPNANVQIYAKWTAKKINLTYNLNTPDGTSKKVNRDVDAGTIASTVLPSASEIEGYSFAGWYYADGNGHMTTKVFNANDAITKDTSVIGKWLYNGELTVVYDPGKEGTKATVPTDSNIYAGGAKVTVAKNATTTSKKKFLGWKLKGNLYHPGDAFEVNKDLANDDNVITLTAIWGNEESSTTMSYNPGNGRGDVTKVEVKNNESVTLKSEKDFGYQAPEKEGKEYYFAGWATSMDDANNGKATYAAGQTVHVDVNGENVLYATWIEKTVITLVANSNSVTYNGEAQSVEGFGDVADGYTISNLTAKATGTNVGEYTTKIEGTAKVTKGGEDVTEKVVVNVVSGKLTISRRNVTLTSASDEKVYDGNALTNDTVTADGFVEGQGATYNVTGTITNVGEKANAFEYSLNKGTNADNYNITKTEGTLKVTPVTDKVTVTITGNTGSVKYDGNSHKVTGYTTTFSNDLYTEANFKFSGKAEASRTNAGQTDMGLAVEQFTNTSANFTNVEFVVTDGYSKVNKRTVTLTSASDEKVYDGNALTKKKVTESEDGFAKGEGATYDVTGSQTNVGSSKNTFTYTLNEGTNADNYEITKTEGTLKVTPITNQVTVTITGNTGSVKYDGDSHEVTGYTTSFSNALYTANDFAFSGKAEASRTDAGQTDMGLAVEQFTNTSANFTNVEFVVTDGYSKVEKRNVTLTSASDEKVYDGHALTNNKVTASVDGFAEGEGATYDVTGSQKDVGESKNTFSYTLNEGTNADNYNITKTEGTLKVTPVTDKVVVEIEGKTKTETYNGNTHEVEGYDVTKVSDAVYPEEAIHFEGAAKASRKDVGTSYMGLNASQFSNTSSNFTNVTFKVTDGWLKVNPKSITPDGPNTPDEKKTGIKVTKPDDTMYNGEEQKNKPTVEDTKTGATLVENVDYTLSYTAAVDAGTVEVTITGIGNYTGTAKTSYEITKRNVTLTSASASKTYDKTPLTKKEVTVSGDGFVKEEGATYNVTGSQTKKGTSKNTFTYELKSNTKASNYTIKVVYGDLTVTAEDGEVVVVITGHKKSFEYDGNEKSVKGYDVSITQGSKYAESDFTFNGNDEVKGTEANTYPMGLKASDFTNNNDNYNKVKFVVTDGLLTITPKSITPDGPNTPENKKTGITATDPADSIYDGKAHVNPLTVKDTKTNKDLVENKDYTLTYSDDVVNVGTVTVTVKGIGNYTGEFTKKYQITPREYTVTTDSANKTYDGTALTAGGHVNGLVEGETVNFKTTGSQTNEGTSDNTYELKFKGTAVETNYKHGKDSIGKLKVTKKSIVPDGPDTPDEKKTGIKVTKPDDTMYNGKEQKNKPVVRDTKRDVKLVEDKDYTLSYTAAINAGTVTVTITGIGNYEGTVNTSYEITPRKVIMTSADDTKVYDGNALTKKKVTESGNGFVEGEGATYDVTGSQTDVGFSNNTFSYKLNKGTLASNYTIETKEGRLEVTPFTDKVTVTITGHKDTAVYDGKSHSVEGYDVTKISNALYKKADVQFNGTAKAEGIEVGTYTMKLTPAQFENKNRNFADVEFVVNDGKLEITPKSITPDGPNTPDEKKTGIKVTKPDDTMYNGEEQKNKPTVEDTKTGATLVENVDYTLSYTAAVDAGTVEVTITGKGNYTGTAKTSYEITKRDVLLTSATDSKVYDKKPLMNGKVTESGSGFVKEEGATYNVTGSQTKKGSSKNEFTYELKSNTKASNYTIEVVYGDLTVTAENGEVVVVITGHKKSFEYDGHEKSVKGYDVSITKGSTYEVSDFTFNGNDEVKGTEANTYPMGLKVSDFTNNNDNYNKVKFVVTDGSLTITPKSITPDGPNTPEEKKTGITATDPVDSIYDGKAHVNALTVKDTKTNKDLEENKDYTLTYVGDVVNVGTVKIEVKGIGNYTGEFTKKYQITPREYTVTTDSANKTYDGTALTAGGHVNGLVEGETVNFKTTGSQTNEGTSDNTYELKFKGTAVETNYKHGKDSIGKLTVKKQSIDPGTDPEKPNPNYLGIEISDPSDEVYDGKEHKWSPTVVDKTGKELIVGTDYAVEYATSDFTNVGTINVTITGIGNYTGKVTRTYSITPREYTITTLDGTKVYDGKALTNFGLVDGIVYGETYSFKTTGSQTEVGTSDNTYEFKWDGTAKKSNYKLAKESIGKLTVKAKSIVPDGPDTPNEKKTGITVSEPSDSKYDGKEHKEVLTVTDTKTGKELVAGTDYSVTYSSDLVNAGTVKVTVAGLGNYTGSFTKTYKIIKRSVTLTSATVSKVYDGSALTNTSIAVSGDGFVKGEGASYEVTGTQTEVGNSANAFEYKLNEKTLASNYNITKVVGTLTITAAPAPVTPATPSTPSSTTSTTPRTPSAPQVITPAETVEKETTPKAEPKKEEKVEEEYTPKASPQYYWALINLICAILTVLFGLLLLISKRHKDEDDDEEDDETKQQTNNDDEEKEQEKKRGLFTRVLAVLIAIVSVVFFLVTEDLSLPWTWTDQWTIWMVVIGFVQIVVFFVGRKWKNVDNDDDDEEAQQA